MILLNGMNVNDYTTVFPDKTIQVWKLPNVTIHESNFAYITWTYENDGELVQLAQLKDLLDGYDIEAILNITFLPYGRQDKQIQNNATFGLRTFAKLLNVMEFNRIEIMDPHSEEALRLIRNSTAKYPTDDVLKLFEEHDLLCYPDSGAVLKYNPLYKCSYMYGNKTRDQLTGAITGYELKGQSVKDQKVLIVDDICDGGATFIALSKLLLTNGAKEVNLYVTHGIFSKGTDELKKTINKIYTRDGEKGV